MTAIPQVVSEHEHNVTARHQKTENQRHGQQPAGGRFVEYVKPDRNLTGVLSQQKPASITMLPDHCIAQSKADVLRRGKCQPVTVRNTPYRTRTGAHSRSPSTAVRAARGDTAVLPDRWWRKTPSDHRPSVPGA